MRRLVPLLLLVVGLTTAAPARATTGPPPPRPSVLALNVCNSGYAGCYATLNQGQAIPEAIDLLRERRPAVVTLNEVCAGDLETIRAATGYRGVFSQSGTQGCDPADHLGSDAADLRYGNIVLVAPPIPIQRVDPPVTYAGQEGLKEQRTVRCLRALGVRACTTHLAANAAAQAQAVELRGLLQRWARSGPVILGGDLNLHTLGDGSPADALNAVPAGWAHEDDDDLMHVIASPPLELGPARITSLARTDHPALEAPLTLRR